MFAFTLLLLGALIVSLLLSYRQHKYYAKTVTRFIRTEATPNSVVVSGIHRGRARGAIAVLLIDPDKRIVIGARVMEGSSIFARFKEVEVLRGMKLDNVSSLSLSKAANGAVLDAVRRFNQMQEEHISELVGSTTNQKARASVSTRPWGFISSFLRGRGVR